jgi:TPR repeat protein
MRQSVQLCVAISFLILGCDRTGAAGAVAGGGASTASSLAEVDKLYDQGNYEDALVGYRTLCSATQPRACARVALMAAGGFGLPWGLPDPTLRDEFAAKCGDLQNACTRGDAPSCTEWGRLLDGGTGVAKDERAATSFYKKGCEGKDQRGCRRLALAAKSKSDLAPEVKPIDLMQAACDAGLGVACQELGLWHAKGDGIIKDLAKAKSLLEKACELNDGYACTLLTLKSLGFTPTDQEALRLCEKAYAYSKEEASCLGDYWNQSSTPNPSKSLEYARIACRHGRPQACAVLAGKLTGDEATRYRAIACAAGYTDACGGGNSVVAAANRAQPETAPASCVNVASLTKDKVLNQKGNLLLQCASKTGDLTDYVRQRLGGADPVELHQNWGEYFGKDVELYAFIKPDDYFNYKYLDTEATHYSFEVAGLKQLAAPWGTADIYAYGNRKEFKSLYEYVREPHGKTLCVKDHCLVRLKVRTDKNHEDSKIWTLVSWSLAEDKLFEVLADPSLCCTPQ